MRSSIHCLYFIYARETESCDSGNPPYESFANNFKAALLVCLHSRLQSSSHLRMTKGENSSPLPCAAKRMKAVESRNNGIIELKQLLKINFSE